MPYGHGGAGAGGGDPGGEGGLTERPGAGHVHPFEALRLARPVADERRGVDDPVASVEGGPEAPRLCQIAWNALEAGAGQLGGRGPTHQEPHGVPLLSQGQRHPASEVAARAGQEKPHGQEKKAVTEAAARGPVSTVSWKPFAPASSASAR